MLEAIGEVLQCLAVLLISLNSYKNYRAINQNTRLIREQNRKIMDIQHKIQKEEM